MGRIAIQGLFAVLAFLAFGGLSEAAVYSSLKVNCAEEDWALLEYEVSPGRKIQRTEAPFTSRSSFASSLQGKALEGKANLPVPGPGVFRTFVFEAPPKDVPLEGRQVSKALSELRSSFQSPTEGDATFALRIDLEKSGALRRHTLFASEPHVADGFETRSIETFLDRSGLRKAGPPLVLILFVRVEEGRVVSASASPYLPAATPSECER